MNPGFWIKVISEDASDCESFARGMPVHVRGNLLSSLRRRNVGHKGTVRLGL